MVLNYGLRNTNHQIPTAMKCLPNYGLGVSEWYQWVRKLVRYDFYSLDQNSDRVDRANGFWILLWIIVAPRDIKLPHLGQREIVLLRINCTLEMDLSGSRLRKAHRGRKSPHLNGGKRNYEFP